MISSRMLRFSASRALPPCGGDGLRVAVADPALGDGRVVGGFDVGQWAVWVVGRQVALPNLFEHRDRGLRADLLVADVARLFGGFLRGVAEHERRCGKYFELVGVSAVVRRTTLDVGVVLLPGLERGVQREQRVGVLGAERAAVRGVAGLQQHRMSLRRGAAASRRRGRRTADRGARPPNAAGVDVDSAVPVGDARRRAPSCPRTRARR